MHPSATTSASLVHVLPIALLGQDSGTDLEQLLSVPFVYLPFPGLVLAWGYRGNAWVLLCMQLEGGFDCIPLGPPFPV